MATPTPINTIQSAVASTDAIIDAVIGREGGYVNNRADLGGPTIWGITEQVARAFKYSGDMKLMPRGTAVLIYRSRYWLAPLLDQVAQRYPAIAAELFDIGVNMGVATAGTFLQRSLNALNQQGSLYADISTDGGIGALTLHALDCYRQRRGEAGGARYIEISEARPANEAFTYGWLSRMVDLVKARFA